MYCIFIIVNIGSDMTIAASKTAGLFSSSAGVAPKVAADVVPDVASKPCRGVGCSICRTGVVSQSPIRVNMYTGKLGERDVTVDIVLELVLRVVRSNISLHEWYPKGVCMNYEQLTLELEVDMVTIKFLSSAGCLRTSKSWAAHFAPPVLP